MQDDASLMLLGNLAVEKKLINQDQLDSALEMQAKSPTQLGEILVREKYITRSQLRVLLDIHDLKVFYHDEVKFGELLVVNKFVSKSVVDEYLKSQLSTGVREKIGDLLVSDGLLEEAQRDAILKLQQRLGKKKDIQNQTLICCPLCEKSYMVKDPDRYRKVRCRSCHVVFEVGIIKTIQKEELDQNWRDVATGKKPSTDLTQKSSQLFSFSSFLNQHKINTDVVLENSNLVTEQSTGKYIFGNELARGGMGSIVETRDLDIKRDVVTKILLRNDSKEGISKFIEEAQITGQLEHPNIVPVYDLGVNEDGLVYFTMKRVRGETLLHIIEQIRAGVLEYQQHFPLDILLEILTKVCDGVAFAHQKRVVHRDLKPENIMVGTFGEVLTMDWGLAKVLGRTQASENIEVLEESLSLQRNTGDGAVTLQGTIAGTPEYMPPEQARGEVDRIDERSDIFTLGGVLFTIVAHELPFSGENSKETINNVLQNKRNEIPSFVPLELRAIIEKAMAYDKAERYESVYAFKADIINYLKGYSVSAKEDKVWELAMKFIRRNMVLSALLLAVFLSTFVGLVVNVKTVSDLKGTVNTLEAVNLKLNQEKEARNLDRKQSAPGILGQAKEKIIEGKFTPAFYYVEIAQSFDPELPDVYYFTGVIEIYFGEYKKAFDHFKKYEDLLVYGKSKSVEAVDVSVLLKALHRINNSGINTIDIYRLKNYFEEKSFKHVVSRLDELYISLTRAYEKKFFEVHQDCDFQFDQGGVVLSLSELSDLKTLPDMFEIPIVELNLDETHFASLEGINPVFLKKLFLNGSKFQNYQELKSFKQLVWLELSDTQFSDLSFLGQLSLQGLSIANTKVKDIRLLAQHPLVSLDITGLDISDINVLEGIPLSVLRVGNTRIKNLEALKEARLEWLSIWQTSVSDLSPVANQAIEHLDMEGCQIKSLDTLKKFPLKKLYLSGHSISADSLKILNAKELDLLSINHISVEYLQRLACAVKSLKVIDSKLTILPKMPLKGLIKLDLSKCEQLVNIEQVVDYNQLKEIRLPSNRMPMKALAALKSLEYVTTPKYGKQTKNNFFKLVNLQ